MQKQSVLVLAGVMLGVAACGGAEPPPAYDVAFLVQSDGKPVSGATLEAPFGPLGMTDTDGYLGGRLYGPEGDIVLVKVQCPAGRRSPEEPMPLTLRRVEELSGNQRSTALRLSIECPPMKRKAVLVVRAAGRANIPVMVDGQVMDQTDATGIAHIPLEYPPETEFQVRLDTSGHPRLRPQNPIRTFTLSDQDEVFTMDQTFEDFVEPAPSAPAPRRRARARTVRRGPVGPTPL